MLNPAYRRPDDGSYENYVANDEADPDGDTALTRGARNGRSDVVRALVASGKVDVNRAGPNGGLPLVLAIRSGDTACVEVLLSTYGIDANAAVSRSYVFNDGSGHFDDDEEEENEQGDTILVRAARAGNAGAVRALVESGKVDVNRAAPNGTRALAEAIYMGHAACVELLLGAAGIDTALATGSGCTPLTTAACVGNAVLVLRLLGATGVAVNHAVQGGGTALMLAIRTRVSDWEACARALASAKGIDLNYRPQEFGHTALHVVCALKHAALAKHLLIAGGCRFALTTAGQDIYYQPTEAGNTALALAVGDRAVAKVFASGVDYWQRRLHGGHGWAM